MYQLLGNCVFSIRQQQLQQQQQMAKALLSQQQPSGKLSQQQQQTFVDQQTLAVVLNAFQGNVVVVISFLQILKPVKSVKVPFNSIRIGTRVGIAGPWPTMKRFLIMKRSRKIVKKRSLML
jgi:hypothetical protein